MIKTGKRIHIIFQGKQTKFIFFEFTVTLSTLISSSNLWNGNFIRVRRCFEKTLLAKRAVKHRWSWNMFFVVDLLEEICKQIFHCRIKVKRNLRKNAFIQQILSFFKILIFVVVRYVETAIICRNIVQYVDFSRIVYSWSITLGKNRDRRRTRMIQINWWRRHWFNYRWNVMIQLIWSIKKNGFFISKRATSGTNAIRNSKRGRREWRRMATTKSLFNIDLNKIVY